MLKAQLVSCVSFFECVARSADVYSVVTFRRGDVGLVDHTPLKAFPVEGARADGTAAIAASGILALHFSFKQPLVVGSDFRLNVAHATIRNFEASMV